MPDFKGVGSSLRKELNEDGIDYNTNYHTPTTPDLIIEEDEESDLEYEHRASPEMTSEQRLEAHFADSENMAKLKICQSVARTWLARHNFKKMHQVHQSTLFVSNLSRVQAQARGMLLRRDFEEKKITFESSEDWVIKLQTGARGYLARMKYQNTLAHYKSNLDKIVRIQNFVKNKLVGDAYRKLTTDSNPSVGTVKNFVHLLDDSDLDFDRELALEDMRQQVIQHIRENTQMDAHVNAFDIQIGLFLRNAITIDEVVKSSGAFKKKQQLRRMSELAANSLNTNPYSLRGIDKESRKRLDLYQRLAYLLQTEPCYLARLLSMTGRGDLGAGVSARLIESTVLTLFGYATNAREEYLLINLCKCCIDEELGFVGSTQEFMRSNYAFMKLVVQTNRGAKERMFFRKLLSPLVSSIVQNEYLDLETDPIAIYHKAINEEESRTGRPSKRKHSATVQDALQDEEVCATFVMHLRHLREITTHFLQAITATVDDVPYGIRIIARKLRLAMEEAFPNEPQESIIRIIGNFIYYRYLNPAIVAPEQYEVIEAIVLPVQRKNLAEVAKMLQQISSGQEFDNNDIFLAPLNEFVKKSSKEFANWFMELTNVEEPETYFDIHEMNDQISTHKPTVYISPYELFHLHYAIEHNLEDLEVQKAGGPLRSIIEQLGPSPFTPSLELPDSMLCLTLSHPSDNISMDPAARQQQLLVDSKRLVIYTIKIQSGDSLKTILEAPVTSEHEEAWQTLKAVEFADQGDAVAVKRRYVKLSQSDPPLDLQSLGFYQLKVVTSRLLFYLAKSGVLSAENDYQQVIKLIARDITGKNQRRIQRDGELSRVRQTLIHVKKKKHYLIEQRNDYENYLSICMQNMVKKRGERPRYGLPFTRQYFHVRRLRKEGREPKFGSFKYSGKQLYERGILVDVAKIEPKDYDKISIILSMDQVGIVSIEGTYSRWGIPSMQVDMPYENLLQTQFEGAQTMEVLDGMVKVNVNLLIYLINKK
ncbi:Rho GTPase activation protein [Zychaea mexicana]|uniref:Rho GTPase activation protein n=1 Tax=Zychaea mexicana TaxID=64656 RepID=UPI0022FE8CFD|nr:Rho GTPase activation protein [Zychaea mexicana]KAI9497788.1 Rho GTPase activation protein [Zychaea mexicana]